MTGFHADGAFGGFSVDDIDAARAFYRDTLGLDVRDNAMGSSSCTWRRAAAS